ncbi:tetraspanin-15-like [Aphidius gifuensis]|uniref:tetraspanin-15-like n=1 Tax=Aphidius gifuensis TaxID=684658 RepID=UPI001CDC3CC6|nr:tetraspanin-15-like [Aphidius gifuensis]
MVFLNKFNNLQMRSPSYFLTISLFILNFFSFLFGVGVIVIAVIGNSVELFRLFDVGESENNELKDHLSIFCTEIMLIGTTICLVSIFGLISAATKSTFCLNLYAAMNMMIIVGLIITSSNILSRFEDDVRKAMEKFIEVNFNSDKYNEEKNFIDYTQRRLKCCGNTGKENYAQSEFLPSSCCKWNNCDLENVYDIGCNTKIPELMNMHRLDIFAIEERFFIAPVVIAGVIELFGSLLALSIVYFNRSKILHEKKENSYAEISGRIW